MSENKGKTTSFGSPVAPPGCTGSLCCSMFKGFGSAGTRWGSPQHGHETGRA